MRTLHFIFAFAFRKRSEDRFAGLDDVAINLSLVPCFASKAIWLSAGNNRRKGVKYQSRQVTIDMPKWQELLWNCEGLFGIA
jgi:hypothetical protein